jgi:glycerophosphoryl diester phosphodiesterase
MMALTLTACGPKEPEPVPTQPAPTEPAVEVIAPTEPAPTEPEPVVIVNPLTGSECDINETADGVLVVVHGPMHEKYRVQETDFNTLRAQTLANGEILPTFEEYLVQAKKNTATKLIIEIKDHNTPARETRVVKNILKMVKAHKLEKDVEYIAFRQFVCDELVKWGPKGIKVAYLNGTLTPEYCHGLGYTGIDYNIKVMRANPNWIKESHDLGLTVNVWTVNDAEGIKWCIDNKVDYITTDNPAEANRQLGK